MLDTLLMGGIFAVIVGVGYAYHKHNKNLEEQEQQEEDQESESYHCHADGFDYIAAKEQNDRQRHLLKQYEQFNRLEDDLIVAIKSGETLPIQFSYYDHCGELQSLSMDVQPEWLQEFARLALDDLTANCSTSLNAENNFFEKRL